MEELIDVLDERGNKTGIVKKKSEIKRDGDFHRAIKVCVFNDKKGFLAHKRHSSKKIYPNLWSINVVGHVKSGETSIKACIREIKEELGIDVLEKQLQFLYTGYNSIIKTGYKENIFYDHYLIKINVKLEDVVIQKEEVADVKYISYIDMKKLTVNKDETITPNWEEHNKLISILKSESDSIFRKKVL